MAAGQLRVDPVLAGRYADSLRLAEVLNRLSLNSPDSGARFELP